MNHTFKQLINEARNQGFSYQCNDGIHHFIGEIPGGDIDIVVDPDEVERDGIEIARLKFMVRFYAKMIQLSAILRSHITQMAIFESKRRGSMNALKMEKGYVSPELWDIRFPTPICYN